MPIATRCTHCGKAYQVAEATVGKQVKCQACGKNFVVAVAAQAAAKDQRTLVQAATSGTNADSAQRAKTAKMEAEFGLQPLPPNPNQVFPSAEYQRPRNTPNPLANHVVEDPGFEQISEADLEAHRKAEAAAREAAALTYGQGEDDLAPESSSSSGGGGGYFGAGFVAILLFYVIGNIGMFFYSGGKSVLLPRPVAKFLNLIND